MNDYNRLIDSAIEIAWTFEELYQDGKLTNKIDENGLTSLEIKQILRYLILKFEEGMTERLIDMYNNDTAEFESTLRNYAKQELLREYAREK